MSKKCELLNNICDEEQIKKYLLDKGKNHNNYKFYGDMVKIESIIKHKKLYLSDGYNWNDVEDKTKFNNSLLEIVNFGLCFSFSKSENVAMWMLYGGIKKNGCLIDFRRKFITKLINYNKTISLGNFENDVFKEEVKIEGGKYNVYIMDVLYYGIDSEENKYCVKRSNESEKHIDKNIIDNALNFPILNLLTNSV